MSKRAGEKMMRRMTMALAAVALSLTGCISLGGDPPTSLLTLTARNSVPPGAATTGNKATALAIYEPAVPQELNVTRVPVQVDDTNVAYLKDAVWVEKPSRLFRRLLMQTVSAQSGRLVVEGEDPTILADHRLRGTLGKFGYDAQISSVIVQFDAVRDSKDGPIETRRFESVVQVAAAEPGPVGEALNRAANDVAGEVAQWLAGS